MVTLTPHHIRLSILVLALLGVAAGISAQVPDAPGDVPTFIERVLVKVNGEIITQSDLEARQITEIRSRGIQPRSDIELSNLVREVTPGVIVNAVDELLLVQRGKDLGYQLSDEQFDEILFNLRTENQFETNEEFEQALQESEVPHSLPKDVEGIFIELTLRKTKWLVMGGL